MGIGNYVFIVHIRGSRYTVRCSEEKNAYHETVHWLKLLSEIEIPVPRVIYSGQFEDYQYIILSYLCGTDLGPAYSVLSNDDKRTIAREVIEIQRKVAKLKTELIPDDWKWQSFISEMLDRAEYQISQNGYFSIDPVIQLREQSHLLDDYFESVRPIPYLDDITTKNLLVENGHVSGIIDVDWMGFGDSLTFAALTCVALLDMECDTDYIRYLMEELSPSKKQLQAFIFYCLLFCVDFMGERGTTFMDKTIEISPKIIDRLNGIYDRLWKKWLEVISEE